MCCCWCVLFRSMLRLYWSYHRCPIICHTTVNTDTHTLYLSLALFHSCGAYRSHFMSYKTFLLLWLFCTVFVMEVAEFPMCVCAYRLGFSIRYVIILHRMAKSTQTLLNRHKHTFARHNFMSFRWWTERSERKSLILSKLWCSNMRRKLRQIIFFSLVLFQSCSFFLSLSTSPQKWFCLLVEI